MTPPDVFDHLELAMIAQGVLAQTGEQVVQTAVGKTSLFSYDCGHLKPFPWATCGFL